MKIKGDFIRREVAGEILLVPVGQTALEFNGMITMDDTADLIWQLLTKGASREQILESILNQFEIDEETASKDLDEFLTTMKTDGFLEE